MTVSETNSARLYEVIAARDHRYDNMFFFAVISTGIYCRPSCPARRPLRKNCRFFETAQEAEQHDFRACKRCRPNEPKTDVTALLFNKLASSQENADFMETLVATTGLSERQLRRLVKNEVQSTPAQLYRLKQLQEAHHLLQQTDWPIIDIAYRANFGSARQFTNAFKQHYGLTPGQARAQREGTA
jgi:AraC family transcriptional regulator of adaptative response / DNA-3-methyladenine glycosylase II